MAKSGWYRLLTDPYLYGLMVRKEGQVLGTHRTILSEEEFNRLQVILGRNGRPRNNIHNFPYKDVLRCGGCGGSVTAEEKWQIICPVCKTKFHKGKSTIKCRGCGILIEKMINPQILHYVYLRCTKKTHKNCTEKSIRLDQLEQQIDNELSKFEIRKEFKEWAIKHLNELNDGENKDWQLSRNNAQKAVEEVSKKLFNLTAMFISPQNTDYVLMNLDEYEKQRKPLLSEKETLMKIANEVDNKQDEWHDLAVNTFNFACHARHWYANGDFKTKTRILGALGSNLTIKDKKLRIDGIKPFLLIEKGKLEVQEKAKQLEPTINANLSAKMLSLKPLSVGVGVDEALERLRIVAGEPARHAVLAALHARVDAVFRLQPVLHHVELEGADCAEQ